MSAHTTAVLYAPMLLPGQLLVLSASVFALHQDLHDALGNMSAHKLKVRLTTAGSEA